MIIPKTPPPKLWPPKTISRDKDHGKLDRALKKTEDQWVHGFIKRLKHTIESIGRKK
jgi:hypothetical protein